MDYQSAVSLLESQETWCEGAAALVEIGERRALVPLMLAYEQGVEASRLCLLDAMKALGASGAAPELYRSGTPDERRIAVHMTELFPDEGFLPLLEQAASDTEPLVREQAARALVCQYQTVTWHTLMVRLLDSQDERVRSWVIDGLSYSISDTARHALQAHLPHEHSPSLRRKIEHVLKL